MYPIYKEILKSSVITHSISGKFTSLEGRDLVIIRQNLLQLYNVQRDTHAKEHVKLVYQNSLQGCVEDINVINIPMNKNGLHYLLISFKEAKLSILEFSLKFHRFITVSIHYYEREELKRNFITNTFPTKISVDPGQRCLALNFYDCQLAILPMRQKEEMFLGELEQNAQQPYAPSFIIDLSQVENKVKRVIDITFLHGYFSPTIAVLFEANLSYSGNPYKPDSVGLIILSLDISHQTYPIIYRMEKLPSDAIQLIALPKPTFGFLIINNNSIIYGNQGSNQYSLGLSIYAQRESNYEYNKVLNLSTELQNSKFCFLNKKQILLFLNNGQIFLLSWTLDGRRVTKLNLFPFGKGIIISCVTKLDQNTLFLGSSVMDSVIVTYDNNEVDLNEFNYENNFIDNMFINGDHDESKIKKAPVYDLLKLENPNFEFNIAFTFTNIGPISHLAYGSSENSWDYKDDHIPPVNKDINDLVACSNKFPMGAITIIHKNIRSQIISSFQLSDCVGMWNMKLKNKQYDDYLIISKEDRTIVLESGNELKEIDSKAFFVNGSTIYAGTLKYLNLYIQIYKTGLRLIDTDGKQVYTRTLASNRRTSQWVTFGMVVEPYILLRRGDDTISILRIIKKANEVEIINLYDDEEINLTPIVSSFIYKDNSLVLKYFNELKKLDNILDNKIVLEDNIEDVKDTLELEEDLYGEKQKDKKEFKNDKVNHDQPIETVKEIRYFLFLIRQNGDLEVYNLPKFQLVYSIKKMDAFNWLLLDDLSNEEVNFNNEKANHNTNISEIGIHSFGKHFQNVYLFIITEYEELIIYEILSDYFIKKNSNRLAIKFNRIYINTTTFNIPNMPKETNNKKRKIEVIDDETIPTTIYSKLCYFDNINNYSGLLIKGEQPFILINNRSNQLNLFSFNLDAPINAMSPFSHQSSTNGLAYYTLKEKQLKIAKVPEYNFELELPIKKHNIGYTPHSIHYHSQSRTYTLIRSQPKNYTKDYENYLSSLNEGEEPNPYSMFAPPFLPNKNYYAMDLISPVTWETIDSYQFENDEHVTCCKVVDLDTQYQARKKYVVVSTAFNYGEEVVIKGKIHVFEIIEVVPEIDNPRTNNKLKLILSDEVKGTITAIDHLNGFLVTCIGSKVIIRSLKEGDTLVGIAFLDVQIYVCSISCIKNFILIGDAYKSIWFLGFQEEPPMLKLLGKDFNAVQTTSTQMMIYENQLSFLLNDNIGNVFIMTYSPQDLQSLNGQKLIYQRDINLNKSLSNWLFLPKNKNIEQIVFYNLAGATDGSLNMLLPFDEVGFRRLQLLQNSISSNVQNLAGLNSRAYRLISNQYRLNKNPLKGIVDAEQLYQYFNLPSLAAMNIAQFIGSDKKSIYNDIHKIDMNGIWF